MLMNQGAGLFQGTSSPFYKKKCVFKDADILLMNIPYKLQKQMNDGP